MMEREKLVALVSAVQQGRDGAAGELYDAFYDDIYYHILKTVDSDPELAADLTQDSFMEILQTIHKLEEPAAFVTWSKQIAYHKCTAYFRKRREILLDETEDGYSAFDTVEEDRAEFIPDEALDQEDFKQTIHSMISQLPEEQRSALLLRYFNEVSVKEIAQIQGVTEGTVKSRLNYARKAIKQAVESYEAKNGIRLHCAGVLPLLLWFFRAYRRTQGIAITAGSAAAVFAPPTAAAAGTAAAATGTAAAAKTGIFGTIKAFAQTLAGKIVAGVTAAAVVAGGTAIVVEQLKEPEWFPETWSGYIQAHESFFDQEAANNGEYPFTDVPLEGTEMYVELEILGVGEDHYEAVLRLEHPWGEYETHCQLKNTHHYDDVVVYLADITPVYFSEAIEMRVYEDIITTVNIQYIQEQDSILVQFPGLINYYGELHTDAPEDTVFLREPIEEEDEESIYDIFTRENLRVLWEQPDGSSEWITSDEFMRMEEENAVVDEYGSRPAYEKVFYIKAEGEDQAIATIEYTSIYHDPLYHVVIPAQIEGATVTELGRMNSIWASSVELPDTITQIRDETFYYNENLQNIRLPGSLRTIGASAFSRCPNLLSLEIPEGVESIGEQAFSWCERMRSISLPSTLTELGQLALHNCTGLESITVAPGNPVYHSDGNCLIETKSGTLIAGCKTSQIPGDGSVEIIGSLAFATHVELTSIEIPEGVEEIRYGAFAKCYSLTEVSLPASLKRVDDQAFLFCRALRDIHYAGTMEEFGEIRGIQWDAPYQDLHLTVHCSDGDITIG